MKVKLKVSCKCIVFFCVLVLILNLHHVEILLPSVLNNLKEQKAYVHRLSDGMGVNLKSSK